MLGFFSTILYILIFILCLSVLIIVHELGHLTAAKVFRVYCFEFSCGMGPAIFQHKRKGGETVLSLRAVPFGGYVSMYGEGADLPEGVTVDPSRSLTAIKKWKQAIIIVSGVLMNAVLALVIFFFNNIAFDQQSFVASNMISVSENSICEKAGVPNQVLLTWDDSWPDEESFMLTNDASITLKNGNVVDSKVVMSINPSFKNPVYNYKFYGEDVDKTIKTTVVYQLEDIQSVSLILETKEPDLKTYEINLNVIDGALEDSGLRIYVSTFHYSFGEAIKQTFKDFGRSSTAIFDSLRMLVTGEVGVDQLSGVVGIGFEAKNILDSLGVSTFIYLWGLISVNLAIFNLIPFPGLDGWQLLVIVVESITRKKFPEKVKNIVSFIGLILLIVFMVFILLKDIWVYMLKGLVSGLVL